MQKERTGEDSVIERPCWGSAELRARRPNWIGQARRTSTWLGCRVINLGGRLRATATGKWCQACRGFYHYECRAHEVSPPDWESNAPIRDANGGPFGLDGRGARARSAPLQSRSALAADSFIAGPQLGSGERRMVAGWYAHRERRGGLLSQPLGCRYRRAPAHRTHERSGDRICRLVSRWRAARGGRWRGGDEHDRNLESTNSCAN